MARKKRSGAEGAALVAKYRESGLTQRGFAQADGVPISAVTYWVSKLDRDEKEKTHHPAARFVEVTPRGLSKPISDDGCGLVVEIGHGLRLQFSSLPRLQYLADIIGALKHADQC